MTHSAVLLALDALATFRLTRLVVADSLTAGLRERLGGRRYGSDRTLGGEKIPMLARPRLAAFITCPWCVSPYLAVIVVACQATAPQIWLYPSAVLALSAAAGLFSEH